MTLKKESSEKLLVSERNIDAGFVELLRLFFYDSKFAKQGVC